MRWLCKVKLKKGNWHRGRRVIQLVTGTFSVSSTADHLHLTEGGTAMYRIETSVNSPWGGSGMAGLMRCHSQNRLK